MRATIRDNELRGLFLLVGLCLASAVLALVVATGIARADSGRRLFSRAIDVGQAARIIASSDAVTHYVYLPVVYRRPGLIIGCVTEAGGPLVGAQVLLQMYTPTMPPPAMTISQTVTDSGGCYRFYGVRSTDDERWEEMSIVIYGELRWRTPWVTYTAGTDYALPTVDTTGLDLVSPPPGATIALPYTFTWTARPGFTTDSYEVWFLVIPGGIATGQVGYATSKVIRPSDLSYNEYSYLDWFVRVHSAAGVGDTSERRVYFSWP